MQNLQDVKQKIFFISDVEKIIGRNRITIRRWCANGRFPEPVKLNGSSLVWHADTINEWILQNFGTS